MPTMAMAAVLLALAGCGSSTDRPPLPTTKGAEWRKMNADKWEVGDNDVLPRDGQAAVAAEIAASRGRWR